jgi:hypothetical protein
VEAKDLAQYQTLSELSSQFYLRHVIYLYISYLILGAMPLGKYSGRTNANRGNLAYDDDRHVEATYTSDVTMIHLVFYENTSKTQYYEKYYLQLPAVRNHCDCLNKQIVFPYTAVTDSLSQCTLTVSSAKYDLTAGGAAPPRARGGGGAGGGEEKGIIRLFT